MTKSVLFSNVLKIIALSFHFILKSKLRTLYIFETSASFLYDVFWLKCKNFNSNTTALNLVTYSILALVMVGSLHQTSETSFSGVNSLNVVVFFFSHTHTVICLMHS